MEQADLTLVVMDSTLLLPDLQQAPALLQGYIRSVLRPRDDPHPGTGTWAWASIKSIIWELFAVPPHKDVRREDVLCEIIDGNEGGCSIHRTHRSYQASHLIYAQEPNHVCTHKHTKIIFYRWQCVCVCVCVCVLGPPQ